MRTRESRTENERTAHLTYAHLTSHNRVQDERRHRVDQIDQTAAQTRMHPLMWRIPPLTANTTLSLCDKRQQRITPLSACCACTCDEYTSVTAYPLARHQSDHPKKIQTARQARTLFAAYTYDHSDQQIAEKSQNALAFVRSYPYYDRVRRTNDSHQHKGTTK